MMTLRDLIDTFKYSNRIQVLSYSAEIWDDELEEIIDSKNIPKIFEPYFNYKVKEISIETYISGQCCGYDIETPYLEIIIE